MPSLWRLGAPPGERHKWRLSASIALTSRRTAARLGKQSTSQYELLPSDHPARFVAELVDAPGREDWAEIGAAMDGGAPGAPAYHLHGDGVPWRVQPGLRELLELILHLAATIMEATVDSALSLLLEAGQSFDYAEVRDLAEPKVPEAPLLTRSGQPDLKIYDRLLTVSLVAAGVCA